LLALLFSELRRVGIISPNVAFWLGHPFIAPILITASWVPVEALLVAGLGTTPGKWLFGVYLQFSISDAYASRDARAQIVRGLRRALRVWWSGIGCGVLPISAVLIAIAYEKVAHDQETDWDFAEDCLVTHGPSGTLNMATGVLGLVAMLWLYGVAWHQPMAESFAWARTTVAAALPVPSIGSTATTVSAPIAAAAVEPIASSAARTPAAPASTAAINTDVAVLMAERRAKAATLRGDGQRMLAAGNWRRAAELCREWADLELASADAWRCLGQAQQAQGNYHEALAAFRRAKQYAPNDRTLDAAVDRAQRGIISEFQARYRR